MVIKIVFTYTKVIYDYIIDIFKKTFIILKNINPINNVHCCVIGCHGNSLHLVWKKSVVGDF